ncbi:50S ribosomal protein L30 [Candidatus Aminicenantes bacterium AC-708-M15]|nr:50S ribosomal protein L30 [SCandidatus Aminicenantes bacterium Aminicenantia_JdfR_composite]MCP2598578.1 50S ribosomal protein L30 [Candidatus Aminicenantes bacterium AC-335-L06]MCP2604078.1 50S ribosomal protein L30 [Candidatus Aminicenantes bacterium AC-708-M15]MCP2605367.1 50S ribosomal protein L30 [Candidatus Aminicenantes bacterium AC-335-O07]MCP2606022.1 50S ribosomal protein L30 [Candidatus Aminicenantes bacterium AC-708-I09]MCP2617866.1 50S ribosomal protein L30 [Candidatus Aminicen
MKNYGKLKIKLVRSLIGRPKKQREVIKGLGLRKLHHEVIREDRPEIWGMINKVKHLVCVERINPERNKEKKKTNEVTRK